MNRLLTAALLGFCVLTGCTHYGRLYPVQGPFALQTPPPVYTAKLTLVANFKKPVTVGAHSNDRAGKISVILANGEAFNGTWQEVYDKPGPQTPTVSAVQTNNSASAWDAVYGQGYYTAHVLGTPLLVHTTLTGNQGTVLTLEWYQYVVEADASTSSSGTASAIATKGVAQDSKGNIYKLVL